MSMLSCLKAFQLSIIALEEARSDEEARSGEEAVILAPFS